MFDLNDDTITKLKKDKTGDAYGAGEPPVPEDTPENKFDGDYYQRLHSKLMGYYRQELDRQSENRWQMATDEEYYDNEQWTDAEKAELKERGQEAIVWNVIATSVDWVLGSEKRGRTDFKILPRTEDDSKPAERKTKVMKYLSDVNRTPFHRSRAFEDQVKVGLGWMEESVQRKGDGEPIYARYESWRNMIHDSSSTELDGSDMRYVFRSKWVDEDIAIAIAPDRKELIRSSVSTSITFGGGAYNMQDGDEAMDSIENELDNASALGGQASNVQRRRVRLIECWYRMPTTVRRMQGGPFDGEEIDENNPEHVQALTSKEASAYNDMEMKVRVCLMTPSGILAEMASPFKHNRFKFIPLWGYRRGKNNLPYGMIRRMRDIQNDINKRASKAQYILSTNKTIMDKGAVDDLDEFEQEVSRPDAIIIKNPGKELALNVDRDLAPAHIDLMNRGMNFIQTASGVTDELLGRTTNAVSGVAVEKRQEQGSMATARYFDNLRLAEQLRGEIELSLVEQFMTEKKQFRITNQRGTPEFVSVNDGLPENDITRTKADFVISEAEWRATMRQAQTAELTELLVKMPPQVGLVILDLLVDSMDIPNRDEIVKRIRAVNGQRDPDATELTPEEQQAEAAKQQEVQAQTAMFMAELRGKEADAAKKEADAAAAHAKVDLTKAQTVNENMAAAASAMVAATTVITMPTTAKVADNLLMQGGWQGGQPVPTNIAAQGIGLPQPAAQPAPPPNAPVPPGPPAAPNGMMQDQPQQQGA